MSRLFIAIALIIFAACIGQAQTISLRFPNNAKLPDKFQKAIKEQTKEYDRLFYRDSATTKHYSTQFILDRIDNDSNYHYIFLAEYWIAFHYKEIMPELIKRITNKKEVGLVNTADLIIWERVQRGDLKFYGHGGISNDDLFTVAGRVNRLLKEISGDDFGIVSMKSSRDFLLTLQNKWVKWFNKL